MAQQRAKPESTDCIRRIPIAPKRKQEQVEGEETSSSSSGHKAVQKTPRGTIEWMVIPPVPKKKITVVQIPTESSGRPPGHDTCLLCAKAFRNDDSDRVRLFEVHTRGDNVSAYKFYFTVVLEKFLGELRDPKLAICSGCKRMLEQYQRLESCIRFMADKVKLKRTPTQQKIMEGNPSSSPTCIIKVEDAASVKCEEITPQ